MYQTTKNNWTPIQNPNFFKFRFQCIDSKTLNYLQTIKSEIKFSTQRDCFDKVITIIDFILFINNKKLTQLHLKNSSNLYFATLFNEALAFFRANNFYSEQTTKIFTNTFQSIVDILNFKLKLNICIDEKYLLNKLKYEQKNQIVNGVKYNRISKNGYLNLVNYYLKTNDVEIINIIDILKEALNKKEYGIILTKYFHYLEVNNIKFLDVDDKIITTFMIEYFNTVNNNNNCIYKAKARWNSLVELLTIYFNLNIHKNFKVTREQKNPNTCHIKQINGKFVKTKLISDIPLEICDDKSIYLLKNQVKQDINLINSWADSLINNFDENFNKANNADANDLLLNQQMFDLLDFKPFLLTKLISMAIITKLIIEHPMITEAFIRQLTTKSYIKIDNSSYLVGYKPRKGSLLAEQKVLLNQYTDSLIIKWIKWTNVFREYFSLKTNKENNSLLLACSEHNNLIISEYKNNLYFRESIQEKIANYLHEEKNINIEDSKLFSKKITFTKIRASKAMNFYFDNESTSKMSEILGHESYKANLLSHYLPEPILQYYQNRWIRIFQKGIICEAMKDSNFLFQATNFQTSKQLDDFLTNHTIKNIPNNIDTLNLDKNKFSLYEIENSHELYISINEENIGAMLALKDAVEKSINKEKIKNEVFKWCEFLDKLEREINSNKEMFTFKRIFENSRRNKHLYSFNKVIYD